MVCSLIKPHIARNAALKIINIQLLKMGHKLHALHCFQARNISDLFTFEKSSVFCPRFVTVSSLPRQCLWKKNALYPTKLKPEYLWNRQKQNLYCLYHKIVLCYRRRSSVWLTQVDRYTNHIIVNCPAHLSCLNRWHSWYFGTRNQ